jgi:hypothetical protein
MGKHGQNGPRMRGADLLNRRVMTGGIELGRVVDVILDESADRLIGLDVRCLDGEHRFLPMVAAQVGAEDVEAESPLHLLDPEERDFYRARGRTLRSPE